MRSRRIIVLLLAGSVLCGLIRPAHGQTSGSHPEMARVDAGTYGALYRAPDEPSTVSVDAFLMAVDPVTNGQFLTFVIANPKWQRSRISPLFASEAYLYHWASDSTLGDAHPDQPVTNVSWFAAQAYARWVGGRLPTVAEWEYVAGANASSPDGRSDPDFLRSVLAATNGPDAGELALTGRSAPNYWGVRDMHGLIWEWTSDFNSALVTGESRGDSGLDRKLYCGAGVIGASDFTDYAAFLRFSYRGGLSASYAGARLGFRVAQSLPPS